MADKVFPARAVIAHSPMRGPMDGREEPSGDRWVPPTEPGVLDAVRIDLVRLHESWMGLVFPRNRKDAHEVYGHFAPETTAGAVSYRLWAAVGLLLLPVVYALAVLGLATRFYSRRVDRTAASLGLVGVVLVSVVTWGALSVVTYVSNVSYGGFVAVALAGVVATVSAALAFECNRRGGRKATVLLAYPFGVTAIFLPPVVAALYSPALAAIVFPRSESLAIWILDTLLSYGGIATFIRATFELEGIAYVGMWFGLAVPVGWALGGLVTLADALRPSEPRESWEEAGSLGGSS